MSALLTLALATFAALFPIVNPFSTAPVFAALTARFSTERRKQQARMAILFMISILLTTLVAGALIMNFFGISMPALRMAGGLIVARLGFGMLNPAHEQTLSDESADEAATMRDVAFTPIALPLLSGPGSIAVTIGMATEAKQVLDYVGIAIGICLVAAVALVVLRSAAAVQRYLGVTGMDVLTRLMGLVLVCIGVQFVFRGFIEAMTYPSVAAALLQAFGGA